MKLVIRQTVRALLYSGIFVCSLLATTPPTYAISEQGYEAAYAAKVKPFMQTAQQFTFKSRDGLDLQAVSFRHPDAKGVIVFLNGRTDTWLKYGEIFYDLYSEGYTIYSYDHRGQGLSPRLIQGNRQVGHVEQFGDYVSDFQRFAEVVFQFEAASPTKFYLVAHSLGGAIAASYLEQTHVSFSAVVLTAPLLQLYTQPDSEDKVLAVAQAQIAIGKGNEYFPGRGNYNPAATLAMNPLTTSEARFNLQAQIWKDNPETIIGGQSSEWIAETIQATKTLASSADEVSTPILLFQAGNDRIADPARQDEFCTRAKACTKLIYPSSKHHLLMERDEIRNSVFKDSVEFLSKY